MPFFQRKEIVFQPLIFKHEKPLVSGSRVTTSGDLVYLKDEGYKFFWSEQDGAPSPLIWVVATQIFFIFIPIWGNDPIWLL